MKRTFLIILGALTCGTIFGLILYKNNDDKLTKVFSDTKEISVFQIGLFNHLDNAKEFALVNNGIVLEDDNQYRVIVSALETKSNIDKCKNYLDSKNINYYIKKININNKIFLDYLSDMEIMYLNTSDKEVINEINYKIIYKYKELL